MKTWILIADDGTQLVESSFVALPGAELECAEIFSYLYDRSDLLLVEEVPA